MAVMKKLLAVWLLLAAVPGPLAAKLPRLKKTPVTVDVYDTIRPAMVRFSGYEKPNTALRETFLVTNLDSLDLNGIAVELEYLDMESRQLHRAAHTIKVNIPGGETRMVNVPAWDRNHSFHYFRSPAPQRRQSTPYKVRSNALYVLRLK